MAAGTWGGGVIILAITRHSELQATVAQRVFRIAAAAVIVVSGTGLLMAALILPPPQAFFKTPWGILLLIKGVLVVGALILGLKHHAQLRSVEHHPTLGTSIKAEALTMCTIVTASALLVDLSATMGQLATSQRCENSQGPQ